MGRKDKPFSALPLPQAQVRRGQAAPVSFIQVQPVFPLHHQAAKTHRADVVHLVHHVMPAAGRHKQSLVDALHRMRHAQGEAAVGNVLFPVCQHARHTGHVVPLGIHQHFPDEVPVHFSDARIQDQQIIRGAGPRGLIDERDPLRFSRDNDTAGQLRPVGPELQLPEAFLAFLFVVPVYNRFHGSICRNLIPQADFLVHRYGVSLPTEGRLVLHRGTASVLQAGLQVPVACAAENLPPAVKDIGKMLNLIRLFRHTQEQVMILAAVKAAAKPSGFLQHRFADHGHMADIIIAHQVVRAVIRLIVRIHVPFAVLRNPVLIRIDHIRMLFRNAFRCPPQGIRRQQVVMIAQDDIFPPGQLQRFIGVSADAPVLFSADDPETGFLFTPCLQYRGGFLPCARPVIQYGLEVQVALVFQAVQQVAQHFRIRIVNRDHHADQSGRGLVLPLRLQFLLRSPFPQPAPVIGSQQLLGRLLTQPFQGIGSPVTLLIFPDPVNHAHAHSSVFLQYMPKMS